MDLYYVAGLPFSDELYHYGVPQMKHGQRRYQYLDGSLTPAGRAHYGVGPPRGDGRDGFVKTYAKRALKGLERRIKAKHTWMASDAELEEFIKRANLEKTYMATLSDTKRSKSSMKVQPYSTKAEIARNKADRRRYKEEAQSFIHRQARKHISTFDDQYTKEWVKHHFKDKSDDNNGGNSEGGKKGKKNKDNTDNNKNNGNGNGRNDNDRVTVNIWNHQGNYIKT